MKKIMMFFLMITAFVSLLGCNNYQKGSIELLTNLYEEELIVLTEDDWIEITYFRYGRVIRIDDDSSDDWQSEIFEEEENWTVLSLVDFTPSTSRPTLDDSTKKAIIKNYYHQNIETFKANKTSIKDIKVGFYGKYQDYYIITIVVNNWPYHDGLMGRRVGDIVFIEDALVFYAFKFVD